MAKFFRTTTLPVLPPYLFEANVSVSIIPPKDFTCVPTIDGKVFLHWDKHINTSNTYLDLYTEIYRSTDLETFELLDTILWSTDTYMDSDVKVGVVYYYKLRFVRLTDGVTTNVSDYTITHSGRVTNSLGFEPSDQYSNKFFRFLVSSLPGTRIYDQSDAAHFSADTHEWQTTCKLLDGFQLFVDNSLIASEPSDSTALYNKRNVTFFVSKKQVEIFGKDIVTSLTGQLVHLNSYLIHTFLQAYAQQFMVLYEKYLQVVADKYLDYSYTFTRGFKPVVSDVKTITIADLYYNFGTLLGLKPFKAQTTDQGIRQYKNLLKSSYTNQDNVGRIYGLNSACQNIFGMSQQSILEFKNYRWWKSDREQKLYVIPRSVDSYKTYLNPYGSGDNHMSFDLLNNNYWSYIQLFPSPSGIGPTGNAEGWLEVLGSGPDSPNTYLFRAHISGHHTTANQIISLFAGDPVAATLLDVQLSGGDTGAGVIYSGIDPSLVRLHSPYMGWESFNVNMYNKKYGVHDTILLDTGTNTCSLSRILSQTDPNVTIPSNDLYPLILYPTLTERLNLKHIGAGAVVVERDDASSGVTFSPTHSLAGEKKVLLKFNHSVSGMEWLTKATLKIFVYQSTNAGFLRIYRVRKSYKNNAVCWNIREKLSLTGYNLIGGDYATNTTNWVTKDWTSAGAKSDRDAIYLKEFFIPKISNSWVTLDITDIMQNIYKYEVSRLDLGEDDGNILNTGFLLSAEGFPDKSIMILGGDTDADHPPVINYEKVRQGQYQITPNAQKYFFVDGTTRWGKLLVLDSNSEPLPYTRTVHERIRLEDIRYSTDVTLTLSSIPSDFIVGALIYGQTSKAVGTITSINTPNISINVDVQHKSFTAETIQILSAPSKVATVTTITYTGNKYVQLSRLPITNTLLRVYHTGAATTPDAYPDDPAVYQTFAGSTLGIAPKFETSVSGTYNPFASQDSDDKTIINLNTTDSVATIGDVIITYQYPYEFQILGKATSDSDSVSKLEGSSRLGYGMYGMSENDYLYRTNVLLPMPSTGVFVDISGSDAIEYSDYNFDVLGNAIGNINRYNSKSDIFKYALEQKQYRYGTSYHKFFKGT